MKKRLNTPSTWKVRRRARKGKRAMGWQMQKEGRRVRRPDPSTIRVDATDTSLTNAAGLVEFGSWARSVGVDRELRSTFGRLKPLTDRVVYPMGSQMRLLIDMFVAGEGRVFGIESLAADALFLLLCGGSVPSTDVLYDDLNRFDDKAISDAEAMMASHGLARAKAAKLDVAHLDVDTTVEVLFGSQEGALPGPNPRYHGRPSYHPLLMRVGEVDAVVGAQLRSGDTAFGEADVPKVVEWIRRARAVLGDDCLLRMRIDSAGDCAELIAAVEREGADLLTKAKITPDMIGPLATTTWRTVDADAFDKPTRQVATITFQRDAWLKRKLPVRVVAVRSRERDTGKQVCLWADEDWSVQVYLTTDWLSDEDDLAHEYHARAGIEPLIAELKGPWAINKVPTASFHANHATLMLKLMAFNLFRRFLDAHFPSLRTWRTAWARRVVISRAGRLVRGPGRSRILRAQPIDIPMRC